MITDEQFVQSQGDLVGRTGAVVTVSERGQISFPVQARRDLGISPGDKLLVLGGPERGLALMTVDRLLGDMELSPVLKSTVRDHGVCGPDQSEGRRRTLPGCAWEPLSELLRG